MTKIASRGSCLKGGVSRYSVIFCAFFARAKNGDWSRRCRGLQTWRWHCDMTAWSAARTACHLRWLATLSDSTVDIRQVDQETHCFTCRRRQGAVLFSGYEAQASWYPVLQGSRSAVTALSIWILYFRVSFAVRLFRRSPRREHSMDEEGIGSVFGAHFAMRLWRRMSLWRQMRWNCVKEASLRKPKTELGCPCRQDLRTGFVLWHPHQWVTKTSRQDSEDAPLGLSIPWPGYPARSRRCSGPLHMSVQFLSAGRCTFENCPSCCPSRDTMMVVPTKKKAPARTRRSPLHEEDLFTVEHKVGGEMFWQ